MPTTRKKIAEEPKPSANCPRLHGYFGHKDMNVCDKFYYCVDGQFNMITCPAGLVFNPKTGICTWPDEAQKVGCSSEGKCCITSIWVWCNSIWVHSFNWLAFNDDGFSHIHNCRSPYQISSILLKCSGQRVVCVCVFAHSKWSPSLWQHLIGFIAHFGSLELFQFTCPKVDEGFAATHPRYADPDDCQFFYVCINGVQPRRNGCKLGQAFDDVSKRCDWARKIPEW